MIRGWQDIPGFFDFMDIYNQAVDEAKDGDTLVEVGSFLGKSVAYMADRTRASGKHLNLVSVDSWDHPAYARWWENVGNPWPLPRAPELEGKLLPEAFDCALKSVGVREIVRLVNRSSVEAAEQFEDASLFLVFIDADHNYEPVKQDIEAWKGKVRPGGILAGHDYMTVDWPGVTVAVDEVFGDRVEARVPNSWLVRM